MKKAYHARFFLCFNPCFPGSSAESLFAHPFQHLINLVSILVFLDQALKAESAPVKF